MTGRRHRTTHDDTGFSVVEVVVAVVMLALVFTAVAAFFISAISSTASLQRRDAAAQLADEAMEVVRAAPSVVAGGTAPLIKGRAQAAVQAQWPSRPAELTGATAVWDAATPGTPVVPLSVSRTVGQQPYVVETFIGQCRQAIGTTVCNDTTTTGARHYRVSVRVSWNLGAGEDCSGRACEYVLTSLVSADGDPLFDTVFDLVRPVAAPDTYTVAAGAALPVSVLDNDTGTFAINPVTVLGSGPANGALSGNPSSGSFTYTAGVDYSGTDTFQYRVTDSQGLTSDPATVTVTVTPSAVADDTATAAYPGTVIDVRANDSGIFAGGVLSLPVTTTALGTATVTSDNRIQYVPRIGGPAGTDPIQYRSTVGGVTRTATLRVTVTRPPAPSIAASSFCIRRNGSNTVSQTIHLRDFVTSAEPVTSGAYALTGTTLNLAIWSANTYVPQPQRGTFTISASDPPRGTFSIDHRFTDSWGQSGTGRITIVVVNGGGNCP